MPEDLPQPVGAGRSDAEAHRQPRKRPPPVNEPDRGGNPQLGSANCACGGGQANMAAGRRVHMLPLGMTNRTNVSSEPSAMRSLHPASNANL